MRKVLVSFALAACGGGSQTNVDSASNVCEMPAAGADAGDLTALFAQRCNVPGSMGAKKWFRAAATLPTGMMDEVQLDLWPFQGAFAAGAVTTGTFTITGADTAMATCGVCLRAMGDKGGPDQKEYFATGGTVNITMVGAAPSPFSATITDATFVEVDSNHAPVSGGCTATIPHVQIDGTVVEHSGGGGGGGSGGAGMCASTVADP